MLVKMRFIKRIGDGYFGRLEYQDVIVNDVEVRDLEHAGKRAYVTMRKHFCGLKISGAFFPYAFITLPDDTVYRVRVIPNNPNPVIELMEYGLEHSEDLVSIDHV